MLSRLHNRVATAVVAFALLPISLGILTLTPRPADAKTSPASACSPAPVLQIAALPPGGVWSGAGKCYTTDANGIVVPTGATVENATIDDTATTAPLKAAIRVKQVSNVTLSNLTINGVNTTGVFHGGMVNGAGIDVASSSNVRILNVKTNDTWGDGVTLEWSVTAPKGQGSDKNVWIDGLTVTKAGRCGLSPTSVTDLYVNHLNVVSSATPAIDFESDLKTVGMAGFAGIYNSTWSGAMFYQELASPYAGRIPYLEFDNDTMNGLVHIGGGAGVTPYVQFDGGAVHEAANTHGIYLSPFQVNYARVVLDGTQITRAPYHGQSGTQTPSYKLLNGASLVLQGGTSFPPPLP